MLMRTIKTSTTGTRKLFMERSSSAAMARP
jgi:hypothetical protein